MALFSISTCVLNECSPLDLESKWVVTILLPFLSVPLHPLAVSDSPHSRFWLWNLLGPKQGQFQPCLTSPPLCCTLKPCSTYTKRGVQILSYIIFFSLFALSRKYRCGTLAF